VEQHASAHVVVVVECYQLRGTAQQATSAGRLMTWSSSNGAQYVFAFEHPALRTCLLWLHGTPRCLQILTSCVPSVLQGQEVRDVARSDHGRALAEVKRLERQRGELLAVLRKQAKLVDVLRRQRAHLEAARLLAFTEDEFMRTLDTGA
jgi:hypothetical protein